MATNLMHEWPVEDHLICILHLQFALGIEMYDELLCIRYPKIDELNEHPSGTNKKKILIYRLILTETAYPVIIVTNHLQCLPQVIM